MAADERENRVRGHADIELGVEAAAGRRRTEDGGDDVPSMQPHHRHYSAPPCEKPTGLRQKFTMEKDASLACRYLQDLRLRLSGFQFFNFHQRAICDAEQQHRVWSGKGQGTSARIARSSGLKKARER